MTKFAAVGKFAIATATLLSVTMLGAAASAEVHVLDFESDAEGNSLAGGTQIDSEWAEWGLEIQGRNYKTQEYDKKAPLLLYNTGQSGADPDLRTGALWGTPDQGNALIIQEYQGKIDTKNPFNASNYNLQTPDDEAQGGHVWFKFDKEVGFQKFSLLDIDDNFGDAAGTQVRVIGRDADNNKVLDINNDYRDVSRRLVKGDDTTNRLTFMHNIKGLIDIC